jgi:hypothetical protein
MFDLQNTSSENTFKKVTDKQALGYIDNGIIGITKQEFKKIEDDTTKLQPKIKKVAIRSLDNIYWGGVGSVKIGINFVTEDQAEKWLTKSNIKLLTPEEVAMEFGL